MQALNLTELRKAQSKLMQQFNTAKTSIAKLQLSSEANDVIDKALNDEFNIKLADAVTEAGQPKTAINPADKKIDATGLQQALDDQNHVGRKHAQTASKPEEQMTVSKDTIESF